MARSENGGAETYLEHLPLDTTAILVLSDFAQFTKELFA
jgi:hypothetical protein